MSEKRSIHDYSVEELERILLMKKRAERQSQLRRMRDEGRIIRTAAPRKVKTQASYHEVDRDLIPYYEDRIDPDEYGGEGSPLVDFGAALINRLLLLTEVGAVVALVALGVLFFQGINTLQEETANAQQVAAEQARAAIPTIAPTPQLRRLTDVVLPTGHTPPENGLSRFNFDEIPVAYRTEDIAEQVYFPPDLRRYERPDETPVRVVIPRLSIDNPITQGVDWGTLMSGVGMLPNGATPTLNDSNIVLAAHNDIYGEIFRHLDQLQVGDAIQIQTAERIYDYVVTGFDVVEPTAVEVMNPRGGHSVTLISCYPYRVNTQRYIVYAEQVGV